MVNLEDDISEKDLMDKKSLKQYWKDVGKAKKKFISSNKIGGNPLGVPDTALKKDLKR